MLGLEHLIGIFAGLLNAALFAGALVVYQSQTTEATPFMINCIKTWVPLLPMFGIVLLFYSTQVYSTSLVSIVMLSLSMILGTFVADTAYLASQKRIGVSRALPIAMTSPIFTYVIVIIVHAEVLVISRALGIALAVLGVITLSSKRARNTKEPCCDKTVDVIGLILAFSTSVLYSVSTLCIQIGIIDTDPVVGSFIRFFIGSVVFVPFFLVARTRDMPMPSRRSSKIIGAASLFGSMLSGLMYVITVKYVGAVVTSVLSTATSLFGIPLSVYILRENLTRRDIVAVFATIIGVICVILGL